MESHNIAKLARIEGTKKLKEANKHHSCKRRKFTFNEAAAKVEKEALSPSDVVGVGCEPCIDGSSNHVCNFIAVKDELEEYYELDNDIVISWCGPLESYNMTGWRRVKGGFIRPTPDCPYQGMAIRERSTQFEWKPGNPLIVYDNK